MTDDENLIEAETEAEEELPPPEEENEAREVNVGNIIGLIVIGLLVIFLIAFIAVSASGKKKKRPELKRLSNSKIRHLWIFILQTSKKTSL